MFLCKMFSIFLMFGTEKKKKKKAKKPSQWKKLLLLVENKHNKCRNRFPKLNTEQTPKNKLHSSNISLFTAFLSIDWLLTADFFSPL